MDKIKISEDQEASKALYQILIPQEILEWDHYFIVADGDLIHFNFEQLTGPDGRYLIYTKNIRYAYSAAVYNYQQKIGAQKEKGRQENIISITPGFSSSLKESYLKHLTDDKIDSAWLNIIQQPFLVRLAQSLENQYASRNYINMDASEKLVVCLHQTSVSWQHLGENHLLERHL